MYTDNTIATSSTASPSVAWPSGESAKDGRSVAVWLPSAALRAIELGVVVDWSNQKREDGKDKLHGKPPVPKQAPRELLLPIVPVHRRRLTHHAALSVHAPRWSAVTAGSPPPWAISGAASPNGTRRRSHDTRFASVVGRMGAPPTRVASEGIRNGISATFRHTARVTMRGPVGAFQHLASVGVASDDPEPLRAQKAALTISAATVIVLAVIWVATYAALGLTTAALIPFVYQVASVASLIVFARTKNYRSFRTTQATMMTVLPFVLQWTLGGYVASSAVSLWALVPVIGTLFFFSPQGSIPWFAAFVGLSVASGVLEPVLAAGASRIAEPVRATFFVLNVVGVSLTAYTLLQYAVRARDRAHARSESLLLNVLPAAIAERLKRDAGRIADRHPAVTVLFADIVDFTPFTERTEAEVVVGVLDDIFSAFDELARHYGAEKIKTIGDAYMVAMGVPDARVDHASAMAALAVEMRSTFNRLCQQLGLSLGLRIGIDSGPAIAGVIGRQKFSYDLWGRTINTASRMQTHGIPGAIQVSEAVFRQIRDDYEFERRGDIEIKGQGQRPTYLLGTRREHSADR